MNPAAKLCFYINSINFSSVLMTLMDLKGTSMDADESSMKFFLENLKLKLQSKQRFSVVFNSAQTNRVARHPSIQQ